MWDFSGGPVVKNPLCNAEDAGSIPGQGIKILHAMEQLSHVPQLSLHAQSPLTTIREPEHCKETSCMTQWRSNMLQPRPNAAK